MIRNKLVSTLCALGLLAMGSSAVAQTVTISQALVPDGTVEATVSWSYEAGGDVHSLVFDVPFDETFIVPQTTNDGIGDAVDGCLDDVSGVDNSFCYYLTSGGNHFVRVTLINNLPNNHLPNVGGTMTFDIDAGATIGDFSDLPVVEDDTQTQPAGTTINTNDGRIEMVDATSVLNVQPDNIGFGTQQTNTVSGPEAVTISNEGTDGLDLEVTSIDLSDGTHYGLDFGTCGAPAFTLADGASCQVNVTFEPAADGVHNDTLTVTSDAGTVTNDSVALSGEGTPGPQPGLAVDPTAINFGTVDGNDMPQSDTVTVTNNGDTNSSLDISNVSYAGDAAFTITDGCEGQSLGEGQSCTIEVVFDTATDGVYSGSVTIQSNDGDQVVSVDGERDSVASLSNNLGASVDVGSGLQGETVSTGGAISNSGSADGDFNCSIQDDVDGVFSTNPDPLSGTVEANGTFDFTLSCALPADAEDGDTFTATLSCSGDEGFSSEHALSCNVDEFEPLPVPTMQTWSLILFALMMLLAGGLSIRFFRIG